MREQTIDQSLAVPRSVAATQGAAVLRSPSTSCGRSRMARDLFRKNGCGDASDCGVDRAKQTGLRVDTDGPGGLAPASRRPPTPAEDSRYPGSASVCVAAWTTVDHDGARGPAAVAGNPVGRAAARRAVGVSSRCATNTTNHDRAAASAPASLPTFCVVNLSSRVR